MLAEEIRAYINKNYFEPARKNGEQEITLRAGTIHEKMGLASRQPAVCNAMRNSVIEREYDVKVINEKRGQNVNQKHAANIWFTYEL